MNIPITKETVPTLSISETELMNVLKNSLYPGATEESIKLVISYCKASGLDPMQKPVHIVPMWDSKCKVMRDAIMPGIGSYRTQAVRSGCYAGVSEPWFGEDITENLGGKQITYPIWCRVVVKRWLPECGVVGEFSATERWKENYATAGKDSVCANTIWTKRPYGQLAKCTEAQALRKAFPEVGAQASAEEMEGKTLHENSADKELPVYSDDQLEKNLPEWQKLINAGKKTKIDIIAMIQSRYTLTPEQQAKIDNLAKPEVEQESPVNQFIKRMDVTIEQ